VCSWDYYPDCPRALIDSLGQLLLQKLLFTAFVGPVLVLVLNTRTVRRCKECFARKVFRKQNYEATTDQDSEVVGIIMVLEIALVFGFVLPLMIPAAAFAFALHAYAFQYGLQQQNVTLKQEAIPSVRYLWFSMLLGAGLVTWMFVAFDWAGRNLVLIALPLCIIAGAAAPELKRLCLWWRRRNSGIAKLAPLDEPLGSLADDNACKALTSTEAPDSVSSEPVHERDTRHTEFYTPMSAAT